jgi:hypothetical protein
MTAHSHAHFPAHEHRRVRRQAWSLPQPVWKRTLAALTLLIVAACGGGGGGGDGGGGGGTVVQLGPDLGNVPPSNTRDCISGDLAVGLVSGFQSCMLVTFPYTGAASSTPGTAVSANIFVGRVTGPMRFVRVRVLEGVGAGPFCCGVEQYGVVFTPTPNSITTVPLGFPLGPTVTDVTTGNRFQDLVGLEILSPTVPVPGNFVGPPDGVGTPIHGNSEFFPAMSQRGQGVSVPTQNVRAEATAFFNFRPSYNLNFRPN